MEVTHFFIIMPISLKKSFFIFIILSLLVCSGVSGAVSVELTLDKSVALPTDTVILKVSVDGARKGDMPEIKGLAPFHVAVGGTSTRMQIINGKTSSGVDYTFYLYPKKKGRFNIGPALIKVKGKTYDSNIVSLTVSDNTQKTSAKKAAPLYLEAKISNKDLYINQQAVYTLKLYRRIKVSDIRYDMPEVDGIIFEQLAEPEKKTAVIDSKRYEVIKIKYSIMPVKTGKITIPSAKMEMMVYYKQNRRNDFFGNSFFGFDSGKPEYLQSNDIQLNIKPLPAVGRDDDFSGLVGSFSMDATLEPKEIKAGDSATFTVKIKGAGNIRQIPDLIIKDIENIKIYEDKPVLEIKKGGSQITGVKTMKWAIVPEKGGEYKIPVLSLYYFDIKDKKFKKLTTEPVILKAVAIHQEEKSSFNALLANRGSKPVAGEKSIKKQVAQVGRDIFPIHTSTKAINSVLLNGSAKWMLILAFLFPPVVFSGLFIGRHAVSGNNKNKAALKSKNAWKVFLKKNKEKNMKPDDVHLAIIEYLNDRFCLKGGHLDPDQAAGLLLQRGAYEVTAMRLKTNIQTIESVLFSGEKQINLKQIQGELADLVKCIEKEIK